MSNPSSQSSPVSSSSLAFQRTERINKMKKLLELGLDPFTPTSHRDFELGFVKFWFDFVHKFDYKKIEVEDDLYLLDDFLDLVLFPIDLLEHAENILEKRSLAQELGVDPQDVEMDEDFSPDVVREARSLFPDLSQYSEKEKLELKSKFLKSDKDRDDKNDLNWQNYLIITLVKNQRVTLAGRLKNKKVSGKIAFGKLIDQSCDYGFQLVFKKDLLDHKVENSQIDDIINFFSEV